MLVGNDIPDVNYELISLLKFDVDLCVVLSERENFGEFIVDCLGEKFRVKNSFGKFTFYMYFLLSILEDFIYNIKVKLSTLCHQFITQMDENRK